MKLSDVRFINIQNHFCLSQIIYIWSKVGFNIEIVGSMGSRCKVVTSGFLSVYLLGAQRGFNAQRAIHRDCYTLGELLRKICTKKEKIDVIRLRATVGRSASRGRSRRGRIRAASITATSATSGTACF